MKKSHKKKFSDVCYRLKASVKQPVKCTFVKIEKNAFKIFKMNSYFV